MIRFLTPLALFINRSNRAHGESRRGQHFAALVNQLQNCPSRSAENCRTIGITSCRKGEGVSTTARNLSVASARLQGLKTLLMDFSGPSQLKAGFKSDQRPGLCEALRGERPLTECITQTSIENLSELSAGIGDLSANAFDANAIPQLLSQLQGEFELILLDLPHADELSICYTVAQVLDGVLLVVEHAGVSGSEAGLVKQRLLQAGANILGVVVTKEKG